jgi:hypothetical protein
VPVRKREPKDRGLAVLVILELREGHRQRTDIGSHWRKLLLRHQRHGVDSAVPWVEAQLGAGCGEFECRSAGVHAQGGFAEGGIGEIAS